MIEEYKSITEQVIGMDSNELIDFHSTRLVEMAGNIIMGYLMVLNSQRDEKFIKTARLFVNLVRSENKERFNYMYNFSLENLEMYKEVDTEVLQH